MPAFSSGGGDVGAGPHIPTARLFVLFHTTNPDAPRQFILFQTSKPSTRYQTFSSLNVSVKINNIFA